MSELEFNLREVTLEDARLMFDWRNDKRTREYSFEQAEIQFSAHLEWLERSLRNKDRFILLAEYNDTGESIGVLRLDKLGKQIKISIYLNPDLCGRGYGSELLQKGVEYVKKNFLDVTELAAEIMLDNIASQKAFLKAGFCEKYLTMIYNIK